MSRLSAWLKKRAGIPEVNIGKLVPGADTKAIRAVLSSVGLDSVTLARVAYVATELGKEVRAKEQAEKEAKP